MRKLFKLGKAKDIPRGSPGRLSPAFGSVASASDQLEATLRVERNARKISTVKEARASVSTATDKREKPFVELLPTSKIMDCGELLVNKTYVELLSFPSEPLKTLDVNKY